MRLDQLLFVDASPATELWARPFSVRARGIPRGAGEYSLTLSGETAQTWDDFTRADTLNLYPYDSQAESYEMPETPAQVVLTYPQRAQALVYGVQAGERVLDPRQPHNRLSVALLSAQGATVTPDVEEPLTVSLQVATGEPKRRSIWCRILPSRVGDALQVSATGEIDVLLAQKFLVRFDAAWVPGRLFEFDGGSYVVLSTSREDRKRYMRLLCREVSGA